MDLDSLNMCLSGSALDIVCVIQVWISTTEEI